MSISEERKLIRKLEVTMEDTINRECGTNIEVTSVSGDDWTISGTREDVKKATDWLIAQKVMAYSDSVYDEELEMSFFYMKRIERKAK